MNKVHLMGRATRDPEIRYSHAEPPTAIARFTLAVPRRGQKDANGNDEAEFLSMVAFGRQAEFVEKYVRQSVKFVITGRLQTGSYTNKHGVKVYTTDVIIEDIEFAESKAASNRNNTAEQQPVPQPTQAPVQQPVVQQPVQTQPLAQSVQQFANMQPVQQPVNQVPVQQPVNQVPIAEQPNFSVATSVPSSTEFSPLSGPSEIDNVPFY